MAVFVSRNESSDRLLEARTAPTISKMAEFLGTSVDEVAQLVEERRIESAILATLRGRGVVVTPRVKNSVRMFVGSMEPQVSSSEGASAAGEGVQSDSTATIVFTDVVGSTSMIERLGDRLSRRVLMGHEKIIREQTAAHGGSVVKALGDGFMLAFRSARRALACAIGIQQALADFNTTQAANTVAVRIGLTVGEPVPEKGGPVRHLGQYGRPNRGDRGGRSGLGVPGGVRTCLHQW